MWWEWRWLWWRRWRGGEGEGRPEGRYSEGQGVCMVKGKAVYGEAKVDMEAGLFRCIVLPFHY